MHHVPSTAIDHPPSVREPWNHACNQPCRFGIAPRSGVAEVMRGNFQSDQKKHHHCPQGHLGSRLNQCPYLRSTKDAASPVRLSGAPPSVVRLPAEFRPLPASPTTGPAIHAYSIYPVRRLLEIRPHGSTAGSIQLPGQVAIPRRNEQPN